MPSNASRSVTRWIKRRSPICEALAEERHAAAQAHSAGVPTRSIAVTRRNCWKARSTSTPIHTQRNVKPPSELLRIGRYQVQSVLGSGNFGQVYQCLDEQLRRQVAIKLRHDDGASTKKAATSTCTKPAASPVCGMPAS